MKPRVVILAEPEFSRPLAIDKIPSSGLIETLEAKESERRNLAERFGLVELSDLRAELTIKPMLDKTITVTGRFKADLVQTCVVTLEPLKAHIEGDIDAICATMEQIESETLSFDPGSKEMEPIIDGIIDLGELAAQNLGIALDPYPRKPGLEFPGYGDAPASPGPLAQLAALKKKD